MARQKRPTDAPPLHGITVTTYEDFYADIQAFAKGKYRFVMVVGPGGTGKTQSARKLIADAVEISGEPTPFDLYKAAFDAKAEGRDRPLVFNDISQSFWTNTKTVALMKQLTETTKTKELQWNSNAAQNAGYPKTFETTSQVLILANKWKSLDENVRALESRAELTILFEPSAYEVHRQVYMDGWFDDQEVYDFMYDNLAIIPEASFRWYVAGKAQREARPDKWRFRVLEMMLGNKQLQLVVELLRDRRFQSNADRAKAFAEKFGSTERQFYRLKNELKNWHIAKQFGDNFSLKSRR
jgi:hypothetical protein